MFNDNNIRQLNGKIECILSRVDKLEKFNYTFKTGKKIYPTGVYFSSPITSNYQQATTPPMIDETKSIPINDLLTMILDHIGLELKVIEGTAEKIELVKKGK
jgi:hypothetical protein